MDDQLVIDYQETFNGEHGKRVLEHLRKISNLNRVVIPTDNNGRIDHLEVMRNEGQRSVVIHIYTMLNKDPCEVKQEKAITKKGKVNG
jgi:hypothetical protein